MPARGSRLATAGAALFALAASAQTAFVAPLPRLRDAVVESVAAPLPAVSPVGRDLPAAAVLPPVARVSLVSFSPVSAPPRSSEPKALAAPSAPSAALAARVLSPPSAPVSSAPPRTAPFPVRYPPIAREPFDASRVVVLTGGLPASRADQIAAALAYEAMQEGSENPTDPKWRAALAQLVADPPLDIDADAVYQLLLAGFEGVDDAARMRLAEAWAERHDGGRFAGDIAYASLRALFNAGEWRAVHPRAEAVSAAHPDFAVRARLLSVLSDGYLSENARAKATLAALKAETAGTPDEPEVLYMEAWLAYQSLRDDMARAILHRIVRDHPASPAARKAQAILDGDTY